MTGDLPCTKEEAAILAAISMHLDDAWPQSMIAAGEQLDPDDEATLSEFLTKNRKLDRSLVCDLLLV